MGSNKRLDSYIRVVDSLIIFLFLLLPYSIFVYSLNIIIYYLFQLHVFKSGDVIYFFRFFFLIKNYAEVCIKKNNAHIQACWQ